MTGSKCQGFDMKAIEYLNHGLLNAGTGTYLIDFHEALHAALRRLKISKRIGMKKSR